MAGKKIQVTLPEPFVEKLNKIAKEKGMSKSVLLALILDEFLKKGEVYENK